jgi:probable biosynthetic protein (TIGR04098 family)
LEKYLHILKEAIPSVSKSDLDIPIKDTRIDSLDLVVIRVALEKYFYFEISDKVWYQFATLRQAFDYFQEHNNTSVKASEQLKPIELNRRVEIRMPQMANNALSENWLLKELGDIHWTLLSTGLQQKSSEFQDDQGNRLYATFVRIKYSTEQLSRFKENETIDLTGEIKRLGNNAYYCSVKGECNGSLLQASLMTSFSQRQGSDNSQISKINPREKINNIQELAHIPELFTEYRLLKKGLLDELKFGHFNFQLTEEVIWEINYSINPFYDINGVGLLYFASYPIISDKCTADYLKTKSEVDNFANDYQTIYRDIFYFSNCNSNDNVIFRLNSIEKVDKNNLIITSSLFRQSDNILMARLFTIKQRTN